jgi:tetratricopeptide (TPR) repeat protein/frataxin-like iron-binding protein CyaY
VGTLLLVSGTSSANATWARVTLPTGERYVGDWLDDDGSQFRIRFGDGNELRLPMAAGTIVEFIERDGGIVPTDAVLRLNAALDALELGMKDLAEPAFRDALSLAPKFARAHYEYARYLELNARTTEAFAHYVLAARLDPRSYAVRDRIRAAADEALARNDRAAAGRALYQYAVNFPNEPDASTSAYDGARHLATVAESAAENDPVRQDALHALEFALRQYPNNGAAEETFLRLASLYIAWKQPDKAILVLTEHARRFPNGTLELEAHLALGQAYLQSGNLSSVLEQARWVVQRTTDPTLVERARTLAAESVWRVVNDDDVLPSNEIYAVARDGKYLWVGTGNGVAKLDAVSGARSVAGVPDVPEGTVVRSIAADAKEVWFGTSNRGVLRYRKDNDSTRTYGRLDGVPSHQMVAVDMDENEVWVGGSGGVARFNRVTNEWTPYRTGRDFAGRDVTCIALTPFSVWVGTQNTGVFRFDRVAEKWDAFTTQNGVGSNSIRSIAVSDSSVIVSWSKTDENGYSEWNNGTRQWTTQSIGPDEIAPQDIAVSVRNGTLWVATGGAVLSRTARGKWSSVEYPTGVKAARVYTAFNDGEFVWVGTSVGLARMDVRALAGLEGLR